MILYKDIITGDEIISDSYDLKEIDGEADCRKITVGSENIDIGAHLSAEEVDEGVEDTTEVVLDVVHSFRLNQTQFDKKGYLAHLKVYIEKVKKVMQEKGSSVDDVTAFEKGSSAYEFFIGESMDPDGMVILLNYREDGVTPYVTV